tara:strand:- start:954 stop:1283 length:330 start_codon:yes stop_codon:yes gene_type:complete
MTNKLQQISEDNQFDIDLANLYYNEDTFTDFSDKVNDAIMEEEIIYYYKAMEYLKENDASLSDSLDIASEYGFTTEQLNSELLATLLYQQKLTEQWYEIEEQVKELFNN